jgi:hypothetical protein
MFSYDPTNDRLLANPIKDSRRLAKLAKDMGVTTVQIDAEIKRRGAVLRWMQMKGLRNFREITPVFQSYVENPQQTYLKAMKELETPMVPSKGAERVTKP